MSLLTIWVASCLARQAQRALTPRYKQREVTDMNDVEQRIRERAYQLWEENGRPEGRDVDYWLQAREEIEPFYKEGDATAGSVESSVAIPMPRRQEER